ncbi:hypothetical protein GCM10010532_109990 [Dactylosporangium siamense]|uniref:Peptidase C14 caspase domain-containing protein n=1 Tax=Dactylosporangium siamense TaxID=685454 RepID=A0A919Q2E7_9ACTN|nr:hypothetical protein Dsi01nite_106660 [Dactylosporangium siamense]
MTSSRRYFIGCGTTRYSAQSGFEDRPELADEVRRIAELFTRYLPYQLVPGFGPDLSRAELTQQLSRFLTSPERRDDDIVVFYYTGHGQADNRDLILPFPETSADLSRTGVWASELTNWLIRGTVVQRFLVILDTCFAAAATHEVSRGALDYLDSLGGMAGNPSIALLAAARPHENAASGAFSQALDAAVRHRASGGHEPRYLALNTVYDIARHQLPKWQRARIFQADDGDNVTEFLPNPRYSQMFHGLNLRTQRDHEQQEARRAEFESHVLPRAQGLDVAMDGIWLFTGRRKALEACAAWLRKPHHANRPAALVVTGDPGSGKSALLSRLYVLSDRRLRSRIPAAYDSAEMDLPREKLARFIHARGQTASQLFDAVCEAFQVDYANDVSDLLSAISAREDDVTVVIDALDEASDVESVLKDVVQPLLRGAAQTNARFLIGTRRHLVDRLGKSLVTLDLDDETYADHESVRLYSRRCLIELNPASPYTTVAEKVVSSVADAIAESAGNSFLVSLITARSLALRDYAVDPGDTQWRRSLPRFAADAMRRDLEDRLGDEAQKARDLLLPLAYAEGAGMPWEDIWAPLASTLSGTKYTDSDLDWLVEHAGYYVIEALSNQRSVYRLYHEALASYLRSKHANRSVQQAIFEFFDAHSKDASERVSGWSAAHPYVHANLAIHAAASGNLDGLLMDPLFLVAADRNRLLAVCDRAATSAGLAAGRAYREAVYQFGDPAIESRLSYLELAALQYGATELAQQVAAQHVDRPWQTRWAIWTPPHPHRILGRPVEEVTAIAVGSGSPADVVLSGTSAGSVHSWNPLKNPALMSTRRLGKTTVQVLDVVDFAKRDLLVIAYRSGRIIVRSLADLSAIRRIRRASVNGCHGFVSLRVGHRLIAAAAVGKALLIYDLRDKGSGRPKRIRVMQPEPRPRFVDDEFGRFSWFDRVRGFVKWCWRRAVPDRDFVHESAITAVVVMSLDSKTLFVTGTADGRLYVWNAASGRLHRDRNAHGTAITSLAVSDDGASPILTSGAVDGEVMNWRVEERGNTVQLHSEHSPRLAHGGAVTAMTSLQVGLESIVVTGGADGLVRPWNVPSMRPLGPAWRGHTGPVNALKPVVIEQRALIASGADDGSVRLWDLEARPPAADAWQGHTRAVVDMMPVEVEGRIVLVTASRDGIIRVFDGTSGGLLRSWFAHSGGVACMVLGKRTGLPVAITAGVHSGVRIWDLSTGDIVGEPYSLANRRVTALGAGYTLDGGFGCAGDSDGLLCTWSLENSQLIAQTVDPSESPITAVYAQHGPNARAVLVGNRSGRVVRYTNELLASTASDSVIGNGPVRELGVHSTADAHTIIAVVGEDLALWKLPDNEVVVRSVPGVTCALITPDAYVYLGYDNGVVARWDVRLAKFSGSRTSPVGGRIDAISAFDAGAGLILAAANEDASMEVWRLAERPTTAPPPAQLKGGVQAVKALSIKGEQMVATVGEFGHVVFRRVADGAQAANAWAGHDGWIRSLVIGVSNDTTFAVTGGEDGEVRVWDTNRSLCVRQYYRSEVAPQSSVGFAVVDNKRIVISPSPVRPSSWWGIEMYDVEAWNIEGAPQRLGKPWRRHRGRVTVIATAVTGKKVIAFTAGLDSLACWWNVRTGRLLGSFRFRDPVTCLVVNESGNKIYFGSGNTLFSRPIDASARRGGQMQKAHVFDGLITAVAIDQASGTVAVGLQNTIVVVDQAWKELYRIELNSPVASLEFVDRTTLAAGCAAGVVTFSLS